MKLKKSIEKAKLQRWESQQNLPEQIASGYETLADEQRLDQNWPEARRLARKGLRLSPRHRSLKVLLVKIFREERLAARETTTRRRAFGGF